MTVIIPAYKPDRKLIGVLQELKEKESLSLIVVNDGSGEAFDPIFREVEEMGVTLLVHPENRGKGAALKTAFSYLLEKGKDEIICTADADGQHLPRDIFRTLEEAEKHPDALVLGCRTFKGDVPLRSRFGNAVSRATFHVLMGKRVYDTQTGLRAFSSALLPTLLAVSGDRYEYEMKALCDAVKKKTPIREVEIETVYLEDNRSSHFSPLRDSLKVYGLLLRCAFGGLYQILSFLFSSGCAFVVDLLSYTLLFHFFMPLFLKGEREIEFVALLVARILSSLVNYLINRSVVFQNTDRPVKTATLYTILCIVTFFAHESLNAFFLITLSFPAFFALLVAQILFFPISFLIQKYFIFPEKKDKK